MRDSLGEALELQAIRLSRDAIAQPRWVSDEQGWHLVNDARFSVVWNGGNDHEQTVIAFGERKPAVPPSSHFGLGIITWSIPYLIRTPPGWNLLVRGPANAPKDGIAPLEGIVETDWTSAPFTMNWKLTRPHQEVVFEPGEVICTIVPQRRGELEAFIPEYREITDLAETVHPPILRAARLRATSASIEPASPRRDWMDASELRYPNRCLPLLIANQAGWCIVNDARFSVVWNGDDTIVRFEEVPPAERPVSQPGGVIAWDLPFRFRTPPGWHIQTRGPANAPKDGIAPLDSVFDTDRTSAQITMRWKLTRPNQHVVFEPGDVICTIVPQCRRDISDFQLSYADLTDVPRTRREFRAWSKSRCTFADDPANRHAWQKHYFRGAAPWHEPPAEHQTRLRLRPFREP